MGRAKYKIDLDTLTLNFHISTIAYREDGAYHGLIRFGHKASKGTGASSLQIELLPENNARRRLLYNRLIVANNALGRTAAPYHYNPASFRKKPDESLVFSLEDVSDEYVNSAIQSIKKGIEELEMNKTRGICSDMRDLLLDKVRNGWRKFAGPKSNDNYEQIPNPHNFMASLRSFINFGFDGYWDVIKSFTGNREPTDLPKDELYRIPKFMQIDVKPEEWQPLLF